MTPQPLPSQSPGKPPETGRRTLVLLVSSASAMLAGIALGYTLGTVHAYERRFARGGRHGV